jgi:hypothetical protein
MNTYTSCVKVTAPDGTVQYVSGTISCDTFQRAMGMALDDECCSWSYKHSQKELVSLVKVN